MAPRKPRKSNKRPAAPSGSKGRSALAAKLAAETEAAEKKSQVTSERHAKLESIMSDFELPPSLGISDPELAEIEQSLRNTIKKYYEGFVIISEEMSKSEISGEAFWSSFKKSIAARIGLASASALHAWEISRQPKVECTYDADGKLKTRKVTTGAGNPAFLSLYNECFELEWRIGEKFRPQGSGSVFEVPNGQDPERYALALLLQARLNQMKEAELKQRSVASGSKESF
jgi:hypothetical protein